MNRKEWRHKNRQRTETSKGGAERREASIKRRARRLARRGEQVGCLCCGVSRSKRPSRKARAVRLVVAYSADPRELAMVNVSKLIEREAAVKRNAAYHEFACQRWASEAQRNAYLYR